jgi:uncharacterized phage infection (PIP) family protein YhgE
MSDVETKNEKDIALIKQEIGYIKSDTTEIKASLKIMLENYITRKDVEAKVERIQQEMDSRFTGVYDRYKELNEKKLDIEDFEPYKTTLRNINWILITAVVGGLLTLVLK